MHRRVIPVAVAVLAAAGFAVANAPAASAAQACTVDYVLNQWSNGFTAEVAVTNGGAAVNSWTLAWQFAGNQKVTNGWNATVTQSGTSVSAANVSWNGSLAAGATARFGFQGTFSGTNDKPSSFTFNGVSCTGDVQPTPTTPTPTTPVPTTPTPSPTTPTPSPTTPTPSPTTPTPTPSTSTPPEFMCLPTGVCDSFEGQTGDTPSDRWAVTYPDCQGAGTATIDRTVAHSGSKSLRINGAAGYCNHVFVRNTSMIGMGSGSNVWYIRYYVRHTTALPTQHVTAVAFKDSADGGKDLRFGGQNGALQYNRASDDATLPEQSPAGVAQSAPLPVNQWNCVSMKIDGVNGTIDTKLNGVAVPGLKADGVATHDIDGQWLNRTWRPRLTDLKLGWESYGEGSDTLWYDDILVDSMQASC